jgi:hypothetical protein
MILSGCGGGNSSGSDSNVTTSTLSGTAATGVAIAGFVYVTGADGSEINVAINSNGSFSADVSGMTSPFMLRAVPNDTALAVQYSYAAGANATVNVTPLTTLALFLANNQQDLAAVSGSGIDTAALVNAMAVVRSNFTAQFTAQGLDANSYDFFTTAFAANGSGFDAVLDTVHVSVDMGAGSISVTVNGSNFTFDPSAGGSGGSGGSSCDTSLYLSGAVREANGTELTSFAGTYTGSEGDYGPNSGDPFVASGSASLVFDSGGTAMYNGAALTVTSVCMDSTGSPLYVVAGSAHFDLFGNGDIYGVTPGGLDVTPAPYSSGGGGGSGGGFGTLTLTGGASTTGVNAAALPASFGPASYTGATALAWQDGGTSSQLTISGNMVVFNYDGGLWSTGIVVGGLSAAGVSLDLASGTVTFTDVTLSPQVSASGSVVFNGTLSLAAPLTGSAVTFTGTGTAEGGSGLDAPAATVTSSSVVNSYLWTGGQGVNLTLMEVLTNGLMTVTVSTPAGPLFFNGNAGAAVSIDTASQTVTFNNLTVPGQSPTTTSLTLNGVLTLP